MARAKAKPKRKRRAQTVPLKDVRQLAATMARRIIRAKYDAAQTTNDNSLHWANADALSAEQANTLAIRKKLRERARYEVTNNSYAKGIVLTLANNLVGPGPRVQVSTPDAQLNAAIEHGFAAWAKEARLADRLRTLKQAKTVDGEAFAILGTNPRLKTAVKLDLDVKECDHFTTPYVSGVYAEGVDGIHFDAYGNPSAYDVLRYHPGDGFGWGDSYRLDAGRVVHWFRVDRPGQVRGVPEITPALPLFAMLRRFVLATLDAAETAAKFAAVLESGTDAPYTGSNTTIEAMEVVEIVRNMMVKLPGGNRLSQLKAEHPNSTIVDFVRLLIREVARCLNIPFHLAAGDYADSNYSTARLGSQDFRLAVTVERQDCEREILEPVFAAWLREAAMVPELKLQAASGHVIRPVFHWPPWDYIDPKTEADADTVRLQNGTETLTSLCAQRGINVEDRIRESEREKLLRVKLAAEEAAKLGVAVPTAEPAPAAPPTNGKAPVNGHLVNGSLPFPIQQRLEMPDLAAFSRDVQAMTRAIQAPPPMRLDLQVHQQPAPEQKPPVVNLPPATIDVPQLAPLLAAVGAATEGQQQTARQVERLTAHLEREAMKPVPKRKKAKYRRNEDGVWEEL